MYNQEDEDRKFLYILISFLVATVVFFGIMFSAIVMYDAPAPKEKKTTIVREWGTV